MYLSSATVRLRHLTKQSSSQTWLTMGIDQVAAFVVLVPEILQRMNTYRYLFRERKRDVLGSDQDGVLPAHAGGKGGAHESDEFFEVLPALAGIVGEGDLVPREPVDAAARDGVPQELVEGGGKDAGGVEVEDPWEGADGLVQTEGECVRRSGAETGDKDVAGGKEGEFCFFVVGFERFDVGGSECGSRRWLVSGGGVGGGWGRGRDVGRGEGDDETACAADSGFNGFLTAG